MSYFFAAADWRKIENRRFDLPSSQSGAKWQGQIPPQEPNAWPRAGSEAVCLRALAMEVRSDGSAGRRIDSVVKIFLRDLTGRPQRMGFLVRQKLAKRYPWMFQCVPYSSFNAAIDGIPVIGHLSRYVGAGPGGAADDFDRLKQNRQYDVYSARERRQFVADLATAVLVLEARGIAHGDLSDGNVLIAPAADPARNVLVLCDFDGFHHPAVPMLPRRRRPLGTNGYVAPFLIDRLNADDRKTDEGVHIASDRFALAVLACELVCWQEGFGGLLGGRDRLLDTATTLGLRDGGWTVPAAIAATWPEGFALLAQAAAARDWDDLPSPRDWLRAVGLPCSVDGLPFTHPPLLKCRRAGQDLPDGWRRFILKRDAGPLHPIGPGLAHIGYRRDEGCLSIDLPAGEIAMVGPIGRAMRRVIGPGPLAVSPDSRIIVGGVEMEVHDTNP